MILSKQEVIIKRSKHNQNFKKLEKVTNLFISPNPAIIMTLN